ncbi:MAG: hypothetical protein BWY74_01963 [Firmicutes bacterium ADurb.Bin419]|nr:MAG: hypothetical protein BWY74_01963 [Firmicutes bacterium ADurb.Bin419]
MTFTIGSINKYINTETTTPEDSTIKSAHDVMRLKLTKWFFAISSATILETAIDTPEVNVRITREYIGEIS